MKTKKNKQKSGPKTPGKRSFFNLRTAIAILVFFILIFLFYFSIPQESDKWSVSKEGVLSYPENRGKVEVKVLKTDSGSNYTLETISFTSKDYTVEGLLRIPSSDRKVPGIVILPGATVPKEGTQGLAGIFSGQGYASLGIEQRNRGGVDFNYDYMLWKEGKEPVEHKMVFDALRSIDVLRQDPRIDPKRIAILGESNGGRFAIIAAALDPNIKGVIGISTSGYDTESQIANINDENLIRFYRSIDPETYLQFIPPRRFVMLHSDNDSIIPVDLARNTFKMAGEPKRFYNVTTGGHGFSEGMREPLGNELRLVLQ
ncbi:MAG: alpha/beta hydrolase [Candidatus Methanoperedens sp.]|nr:alpha/beta hydrolase [Candidatus Methanoperedens sp.]MCZ7369283.1 alpha/beta hydrolase [Candidatus Methanoperedens sp.]